MSIISFVLIQMIERVMQVRRSTAALANSTRDELRRSPRAPQNPASMMTTRVWVMMTTSSRRRNRTANKSSKMEEVDGG